MRTPEEIAAACDRIDSVTSSRVAGEEAWALAADARELVDAIRAAKQERDEALTSAQSAHVERDALRGALEDATTDAAQLREALGVILTAARTDHRGQHLDARAWLDARDIYSGDVSGEGDGVIEMVARAALSAVRTEGAPPHGDDAEVTVRT